MREESFLSSWLREDVSEKEERMVKVSEKRKREEEKEANETGDC